MRHDAVLGDSDAASGGPLAMGQDGETLTLKMTNKTFDTFASDWTQCTNVAFDKLLKKFQLQNAGHKVSAWSLIFYSSNSAFKVKCAVQVKCATPLKTVMFHDFTSEFGWQLMSFIIFLSCLQTVAVAAQHCIQFFFLGGGFG